MFQKLRCDIVFHQSIPFHSVMADYDKCAKCSKTVSDSGNPLKKCAKCKTVFYCSRTCQTSDYKVHKKICGLSSGVVEPVVTSTPERTFNFDSGTPVVAKGLDNPIKKPFTHLHNKTWLHNRSEKDVFRLLIDCFRLMLEDDFKFEGNAMIDSLYSGECADSRIPFRLFLTHVEKVNGLLPAWWTAAKLDECVAFGLTDSWANLGSAVEKADLIDHYGDSTMPMQLRIMREIITGRGPMGQSGMEAVRMYMASESGTGPQITSTVNISKGRRN